MDNRLTQLQKWLAKIFAGKSYAILPLASDASFRRYFRITCQNQSWIVMDAPPTKENCYPFVAIANGFAAKGIQVPSIVEADLTQGFLLLSDLGEKVYLAVLNPQTADQLYQRAIDTLLLIQSCQQIPHWPLPHFNHDFMLNELHKFQYWFLQRYLQLTLTQTEQRLLNTTFATLVQSAVTQPQICIHRDYHSRNLLLTTQEKVGVLDFQDAMLGPITYDVVSLLKDCYINWPRERVITWLNYYNKQLAQQAWGHTLHNSLDNQQLLRWFELMGIQRHLKASFIFARKYLRDQNKLYLHDIPRTLNYVADVLTYYPELAEFQCFFNDRVMRLIT